MPFIMQKQKRICTDQEDYMSRARPGRRPNAPIPHPSEVRHSRLLRLRGRSPRARSTKGEPNGWRDSWRFHKQRTVRRTREVRTSTPLFPILEEYTFVSDAFVARREPSVRTPAEIATNRCYPLVYGEKPERRKFRRNSSELLLFCTMRRKRLGRKPPGSSVSIR